MRLVFKRHFKERMNHRAITPDDVRLALTYGKYLYVGNRQFRVIYDNIIVVAEELNRGKKLRMNLISAFHTPTYEKLVKKTMRKQKLSYRQASFFLRNDSEEPKGFKVSVLPEHRKLAVR